MKKQLLLLLFSLFAVMGYARTVTVESPLPQDMKQLFGEK